jgi:hypothetical protein
MRCNARAQRNNKKNLNQRKKKAMAALVPSLFSSSFFLQHKEEEGVGHLTSCARARASRFSFVAPTPAPALA